MQLYLIQQQSNFQLLGCNKSYLIRCFLQYFMDQEKKESVTNKFDGLSTIQVWAYGVGHLLNDLTAACWFNYLLFFLKTVVRTPAASLALLAGQLCDGLATPIVGITLDRLGKRTPIYILGLVIILISFLPVFRPFHGEWQWVYYAFFPGVFNVGWACLQISHMSLLPALTCSRRRRDRLGNCRNSAAFLANLLVLAFGLSALAFLKDRSLAYQSVAIFALSLGLPASLFFLWHIREGPLTDICKAKKEQLKLRLSGDPQSDRVMRTKEATQSTVDGSELVTEQLKAQEGIEQWLRRPSFYLFGLCYMGVRLHSNLFGTFVPFYLAGVLQLSPDSIALVPLLVYASSSLASLKIGWLYDRIGRRCTLLLGTVVSGLALAHMAILSPSSSTQVYFSAIAMGLSQAMVLSTGVNLISQVVGSRGQAGGFVFGVYSFLDKIAAGITIFLVAGLPAFSLAPNELDSTHLNVICLAVLLLPFLASLLAAGVVFCFGVAEYAGQRAALSQTRLQRDEFVHSVALS